jgi:hypothetical protein
MSAASNCLKPELRLLTLQKNKALKSFIRIRPLKAFCLRSPLKMAISAWFQFFFVTSVFPPNKLKPADKSAEILECGGLPQLFLRGQAAQ